MKPIDFLLHAKWILTMDPIDQILENHAVAVKANKIIDIGSVETLAQQYTAQKTYTLDHHVLMPGLINAHTHTPMNLFRGLADDLPLMTWLQNHIWPAEQAIMNAESVRAGTDLAIAEMLRSGITCFNDHYFFDNTIAQAAIDAGIRACIGLTVINVPTQWAEEESAYLALAEQTLAKGTPHSLISWAIAPHAPYTVSDDAFKKIKTLSKTHDIPIHIHLHETADEITQSLKIYHERPLSRLHKLGLLSSHLIAVHMTQLTPTDIELARDNKIHIIHCPESNLKLASGFAPIAELLKANINVAIGTDGAASNNDLDLLGEMRTAALIGKAVASDPTQLNAQTVVTMSTINGAKALGLNNHIGSITVGKCADLIAIDYNDCITQPVYNPFSYLAYAANRLQVSHVWIDGNLLLNKGEFTRLNLNQIMQRTQIWRNKITPFQHHQQPTDIPA